MLRLLSLHTLVLAVHLQRFARGAGERVTEHLEWRAQRLRDETGAQAVEYALLIAVAAVACGALILAMKTKMIETAISGLVKGAVSFVTGWFKKG